MFKDKRRDEMEQIAKKFKKVRITGARKIEKPDKSRFWNQRRCLVGGKTMGSPPCTCINRHSGESENQAQSLSCTLTNRNYKDKASVSRERVEVETRNTERYIF